jgi:hypothetical protein
MRPSCPRWPPPASDATLGDDQEAPGWRLLRASRRSATIRYGRRVAKGRDRETVRRMIAQRSKSISVAAVLVRAVLALVAAATGWFIGQAIWIHVIPT